MRVFISHQQADSQIASQIALHLKQRHDISSYLDVIDPFLQNSGQDLASHIRTQMANCTQLLAVVSFNTRHSQWVPWEIGVATEKNFPLATFANYTSEIPEFLQAWPYLRSLADVDSYAAASKAGQRAYIAKRATQLNETASLKAGTETFFKDLRQLLKQPVSKRAW